MFAAHLTEEQITRNRREYRWGFARSEEARIEERTPPPAPLSDPAQLSLFEVVDAATA